MINQRREKTVRVFLDYGRIYGLSGANVLLVFRHVRCPQSQESELPSYTRHREEPEEGDNVIGPPFFNIPLDVKIAMDNCHNKYKISYKYERYTHRNDLGWLTVPFGIQME